MRKGEIVTGSLSGLSFLAALDAYVGTGTSSWLADICFSGDAPAPMINGMPMEDHSKHAAYFTSAGLIFLATALGWEFAETQAAKMTQTEPQGTERKRLLACIIHVAAAADCTNLRMIESAFEKITGYSLGQSEAKDAFIFLMRENAPGLHRMLAGASDKDRKILLQAIVLTWSTHGMDSEASTKVTEQAVAYLGFDEDDMCKTLDRLWLKEKANTGAQATYKVSRSVLQKSARASWRGAKTTVALLAPHARRISARAYSAIQR